MRQKLNYINNPLFVFRDEIGMTQGELANLIGSTRSQIARQENGGVDISSSSKLRLQFIAQKVNEVLTNKIQNDTIALQAFEEERQVALRALIKKYRYELYNLVFMQEEKQPFFEKTLLQYKKIFHVLEHIKGEVDADAYHDLTSSSRITAKHIKHYSPAKQMKISIRILQLKTSIEWAEKQLDNADWMQIENKESND
jgi:transcriptional regulator with XRE-family HTH domain